MASATAALCSRRRLGLGLVVVAWTLVATLLCKPAPASAQLVSCQACPLDVDKQPVCAIDGLEVLELPNECVAWCQGLDILGPAPCDALIAAIHADGASNNTGTPSDGSAQAESAVSRSAVRSPKPALQLFELGSWERTGEVGLEQMMRFGAQGLRFLAKAVTVQGAPQELEPRHMDRPSAGAPVFLAGETALGNATGAAPTNSSDGLPAPQQEQAGEIPPDGSVVVDPDTLYTEIDDGSSTQDDRGWAVTITFPDKLIYVQTQPYVQVPPADKACTWGCVDGEPVDTSPPDEPTDTPEDTSPARSNTYTANDTPSAPPPAPISRRLLGGRSGAASAAGRKLSEIIGSDDRVESMTEVFPNTATIQIRFHIGGTQFGKCSGSLISPSVVLTNGHCVYSAGDPQEEQSQGTVPLGFYDAESMYIYTRHEWSAFPMMLRAKVVRMTTTRGWIREKDHAFDVALIYLDEPIGDDLGFFRVGYDCEREEYDLELLGFPGQDNLGLRFRSDCTVAHSVCSNNELIRHDCDTTAGQSGSPMFTQDDNIIRAVHTCRNGDLNCAAAIRPSIYGMINLAVNETLLDAAVRR